MTRGACGQIGAFRSLGQLESTPSNWHIVGEVRGGTIHPQCVGYFGPPANDACGLHIVLPGEEG